MKPLNLTDLERDMLKEVAGIGGGHAIGPLSQMIGQAVQVKVPDLQLIPVEEVSDLMGHAEQMTTVVIIKILGDANGVIVLVLGPDDAAKLVGPIAGGQEVSALEE